MGGIFGGSSGSSKVITRRQIPPPAWQESQLLSNLYNLANYTYYQPSPEFVSALRTYYKPSEEFVRTMENPYLSMLPYKEKIGDVLNRLASRGVVNSTVTQRALEKIGQYALERGRELKSQTLAALEEARRLSEADRIKRLALLEDAKQLAADRRYRNLFNLWSTLYQGRMGVPTTVQTATQPSMLSQALGQATGLGLGYWLGLGGGFGKIADAVSLLNPVTWAKELFGSTSGY